MKESYLKLAFILLVLSICFTNKTHSQTKFDIEKRLSRFDNYKTEIVDGYKVIQGERPPIDLNKVPIGAYETGRIFIKLTPSAIKSIPGGVVKSCSEGFVSTGLETLDALNEKFGAITFTPILKELYEASPKSQEYHRRHMAWGFHLWYIVDISEKMDVKEAVKGYAQIDEIELAEPVYKKRQIEPIESRPLIADNSPKFSPNDSHYATHQWSFNNTGQSINGVTGIPGIDISAQNAWEIEKGNSNVIVSIHDGGIQYNHPDLAANMWSGIGPDGTSTIADSHGTHVAGTVAAVTNNSIGVAGVAGGSGSGDGVRLMSIDIFNGSISTYAGYVYAANNGAAISQNSWGYTYPNVYNTSDLNGIDYFNVNGGGNAITDGGIVIFATGNDNDNGNWYPGYYSGTMAVASHTNRGQRSGFSNYGSWVDISAPGSSIASTDINNNYSYKSGTSMACPHVSGVAALVVSKYHGEISKSELWTVLLEGVETDLYDFNPNFRGLLGSGRTNAHKALAFADSFVGYAKLTTKPVLEITESTAVSGGRVIQEGNSNVIARGVVWGKTPSPTIDNNNGFTVDGSGPGEFASQITSLDLNTTYYVRAYATNGRGTSYGDQFSFSTLNIVNIYVYDLNKDPISQVNVNFGDLTATSNTSGEVTFIVSRGSYEYKTSVSGYESTRGAIVVEDVSNVSRKLILYTESSSPANLIGETQVCRGSELIYSINISPNNYNWEVVGGEVISSTYRFASIWWYDMIEYGYLIYRTIDEEEFHTTFELESSINQQHTIFYGQKPTVITKGNLPLLICTTPDLGYQWIKDGIFIEGQTNQFYAARGQSGNFQVQVIDLNQCPNTSMPLNVESTAQANVMLTFPNPTKGSFTLSYEGDEIGDGQLTITNSYGKVIHHERVYKQDLVLEKLISLPSIPQGVYIIQLRIGNSTPVNSKLSVY